MSFASNKYKFFFFRVEQAGKTRNRSTKTSSEPTETSQTTVSERDRILLEKSRNLDPNITKEKLRLVLIKYFYVWKFKKVIDYWF